MKTILKIEYLVEGQAMKYGLPIVVNWFVTYNFFSSALWTHNMFSCQFTQFFWTTFSHYHYYFFNKLQIEVQIILNKHFKFSFISMICAKMDICPQLYFSWNFFNLIWDACSSLENTLINMHEFIYDRKNG